jgi:outer membrane murein-binding lipoprotein Lpp
VVLSHEPKEEDVRKLIAAAALLAVVFVLGCQDTQKVTELQGQVDKLTQQVTDLNAQVAKVTLERDSVIKLVADLQAKMPAPKGGTPAGGAKGGTPAKPPRTGR